MKRTYLKKSFRYWTVKKLNKHSMKFWYFLIACMALVTVWAVINRQVNKGGLVSPLVNIVEPIYAKETETIGCEDVVGYIRCKFYSGDITEYQAKMLIAIGKAESGLRENARNRHSSARGVFQIVAGTWYSNNCVGDPMKFKDNTDCAIKIMKSSGFYPWDAFNRGMHKKFIKDIVI